MNAAINVLGAIAAWLFMFGFRVALGAITGWAFFAFIAFSYYGGEL